jgi:Tol biopolymer transport system component
MTDNDHDRSVAERLRAYESRVAAAPVPGLHEAPAGRRGSRLAWTLVVAAGGAAAGFALALALNARIGPPVGQPSSSPTPTLEAPASGAPSPVATEPAEASPPPQPTGTLAISRDGDVVLVRPDGSTVAQLTDDTGSSEAPVAWLLDGSALVVAVTADGNPYSSTLWLVSADGFQSTELGVVHPVYGASVWSPDGTRMAFGGDGSPASGIKVLDLADGTLISLTDDGGTAPLWSPDGTLIAYNGADGSGTDIHVVPVDGGEPVALAPDPAQDQVIRWVTADDGLKIVFESWRDTDESKFAARPWVMNADGTQVELLSESDLDIDLATREPSSLASADGEWIVTVHPTGAFVGRDPVAGDERLLPETQGWDIAELSPTFSPDGRYLAYSHAAGGEEPSYVIAVVLLTPDDPQPIEPDILTAEGVSERAPAWRPVP